MIDRKSDCREAEVSGGKSRWMQRGVLATVCALVIGVYAYAARSGYVVSSSLDVADSYYNLLVQGFRAGQLNLKTAVPSGLAQLADPYDPVAHSPYPVDDMSYYKGKLYLYYGVTPAVLFFWPYVALTGDYLLQKDAAVVFCVVGFLASVYLLRAVWRRYFAEVSVAVVAAGALALGLVTCTPSLLARCDVWEVSISCGYAFTMLALATIWKALHHSSQRGRWLAAASLSYGLVVGARPSLIFGAAVLLVPVVDAWRERRRVWALLIAAIGPIALIGLGLMLYNFLRFDSPFEFGLRYALSGDRRSTVRPFGLRYLWFHFRVYFLEPARWSGRFPFVHDITVAPVPAGHGVVEHPFGVLTNIPVVWLALAVPLAWRGRSGQTRSTLCGFLAALAVLFVTNTLALSLFFSASIRYEVEFLPALVLLAVVGILGLERTLADRPLQRRTMRWGWSLLLSVSVAFNLLASVVRCAEAHYNLGVALLRLGKVQEAIGQYEQALRIQPDFAGAHNNLGNALLQAGRVEEAIGHYEQAVRINPDYAEAHNNLGTALMGRGRLQEAIGHYEQAVRIKPDYAHAHYNLGVALEQAGRAQEAIGHYERALRIKPDFVQAQNALARTRAVQ
jgi:tetratricopeptide (TPR) repeat protein